MSFGIILIVGNLLYLLLPNITSFILNLILFDYYLLKSNGKLDANLAFRLHLHPSFSSLFIESAMLVRGATLVDVALRGRLSIKSQVYKTDWQRLS